MYYINKKWIRDIRFVIFRKILNTIYVSARLKFISCHLFYGKIFMRPTFESMFKLWPCLRTYNLS